MWHEFLIVGVILIAHILATSLGVGAKVVVGTVGNTIEFFEAKRKLVFHVNTGSRIMSPLVIRMVAESQVILLQTKSLQPIHAKLLPTLILPFSIFRGNKVFQLHLF